MIVLITTPGCATTFRGSSQRVEFLSSQAGVRVEVAGQTIDVPGAASLRRNQTYRFRASAPGCHDEQGFIVSRMCDPPHFWCVMDFVGAFYVVGIPSLIVDWSSGALADLVPGRVNLALGNCRSPMQGLESAK